jgi:hypothetical protein
MPDTMFRLSFEPEVYEKNFHEYVLAVDPGPVYYAKNKPDHSLYS